MQLTVEIPDDLIGPLSVTDPDISRRALEALGVAEYKKGPITKAQCGACSGSRRGTNLMAS